MTDPAGRRAALRLDLLFYLVGLTFAAATALWSEFYGYRVWGNFATVGYLFALGLTLWHRSNRWLPVGAVALCGIVVPLGVLVFRRSPTFTWGPWPWSWPAQPEVWVVERSARLLLANGTPYPDLTTLGRTPIPDDYSPYGPVMTVFGLPRAVFGDGPLTDARVWFLVGSVLAIVLALGVLGWPRIPVLAGQLVVASPLTALTATVAGDDLPVIALIVLATALVYRAGPIPAGIAAALMVSAKLTALPALLVLAVGMFVRRGGLALVIFLGTVFAATAIIVVPVLLTDPGAFVEQVIRYPAGLGQARSPAASPLPGHLIARTGPLGHAIAIGLLGVAACAITAWVVLRPPRTAADATGRIAAGLGAAIALAPATRWGYLIYPLVLLGVMIVFSRSSVDQTAESHAQGGIPV
jgi:Glycosyltransferase family 87